MNLPECNRRIESFVAAYQASPYATEGGRAPGTLIPSPVDEEMIRDHENLIGAALPPLFRAYLMGPCLPCTDLYVGQLPPIDPDRPFEYVERWSIERMDEPFYRRNERLIPFSHGAADCSDLCFDVYCPDDSGDYPVVDVWHGMLEESAAAWSDLRCERSRVFRSFSDYLDFLRDWLIYRTSGQTMMFESWRLVQGRGTSETRIGNPPP